jgi:hypothetical protein
MKRFESCRNVYKTFKILTVTSLYILEILCFIKEHMVNLKTNSQVHDCNTRGKNNCHILGCNTSQYQKTVTKMGIKLYNSVPNSIKSLNCPTKFKKGSKANATWQHILYLTWILQLERFLTFRDLLLFISYAYFRIDMWNSFMEYFIYMYLTYYHISHCFV